MIQLRILSGKQAGVSWVARRFPVRAGRAAGNDLKLEEPGVWDEHFRLEFVPRQGIRLRPGPSAPTLLNGEPTAGGMLRNGDLIEAGALKLRFWLSPTRQRALALRETLTWAGIATVTAGQLALIYWLVKLV